MTSVRSFSALSGKERIGPDQARRFAGIVEAEATRTTRLLDDLLVLSGLRDGQVSIQRQEGFLDALIDRAVLSSGMGSELSTIRDPAAEAMAVATDLDRLAGVFINLISHAQNYYAERPELCITARA